MDNEAAAKTKKPINAMIFRVTPIRTAVSFIGFFLIFWMVRSGLEVADEAELEFGSSGWGFHIGVVTILFGVVFVALGIPILVNLLLKLSEQFQKHDDNICPGGDIEISFVYSRGLGVGEIKSMHVIIGRIAMTIVTIILLAWASYTGYRLATTPRSEDSYYPLIFPIGIVTIVFGAVYIIIGLALIVDLTLALGVQYVLRKKKGSIIHQDPNSEAKSTV